MHWIRFIEINYLRSIHRLRIGSLGDLTVFSGANDVGKSNLLRALNLFFNNSVDWQRPIVFYQDFSLRRLDEVRRESIKGKQFIRITIQFERPKNYEHSLPPTFKVTRTWLRDSIVPQETNDLEQQEQAGKLPSSAATARRMLSQFMNRLRFEYVPAVKDREYFAYVLRNLQETLLARQMGADDPIIQAVKNLNTSMGERAATLRRDFQGSTRIEADVSLPEDPTALFRAFSVSTKWQDGQESVLPLAVRGDGIQARYIPSLLHYIAENSRLFYIWGFEEPENSVEYNLAIDLANKFEQTYTCTAQILVTSHSPAFVSLQGPQTVCYRVYQTGRTTKLAQVHPEFDTTVVDQLANDLGMFRIQKELHQRYLERRDDLRRAQAEVERLQKEVEQVNRPVVYMEGKTDPAILFTAWKKLFGEDPMPFVVKSCDPLAVNMGGGAGGANTLAKLLSTTRAESSHLVIGLFDADAEGKKEYNGLPEYLVPVDALEARISQNHRAAAALLPVPPNRQEYAEHDNFCMEFYFSDEVLSQKTAAGRGLVFRPGQSISAVSIGGRMVNKTAVERPDILPARTIVDGKTTFAERIVPDLSTTEFEGFRILFDRVQVLLAHLQSFSIGDVQQTEEADDGV